MKRRPERQRGAGKASGKSPAVSSSEHSEPTPRTHETRPLEHAISEWSGEFGERKWTLYSGSASEALGFVPTESVHCVVTSPPYFWLRNYGVQGQIGREDTVQSYVESIARVMAEVFRVLRRDGLLFLNLGDTYYSGKGQSQGVDRKSSKRRFGLRAVDRSGGLGIGLQRKSAIGIPWRVALRMCEEKWVLRTPIIWHREKCLPEAVKDRPRRAYEYIFMFAKSRHYHFNRQGLPDDGVSEDVWTIPARPKGNGALDTAPFPDELVARCLTVGCPEGGTVLDPFCGSGTTLRVALRRGCDTIGIDLNPKFCEHVAAELASLVMP